MKYPNNLAVYLSNRCNLTCSYCYVAVNQGSPEFLDVPAIKKAIEQFLSLPHPKGTELKFSFLGGEPLLQFRELSLIIRHIRSRAGTDVMIHVFTNGTLLTPGQADFFYHQNVELTISLDGKEKTNDSERKFHGNPEKSVFEAAMKRLEPLAKDRMGINMVFTHKTIGSLLTNIHYFYTLGFPKISFTPDLYEIWPEEKLEALTLVMEQFHKYYRQLIDKNVRLFAISNLYAMLDKADGAPEGRDYWWKDCHNLVLGADGRFYNCDKPLGFSFDQIGEHEAGSIEKGVNWVKRAEDFDQAITYVNEKMGPEYQDYASCPMGVYFASKIKNEEPAPAIKNFHQVSSIYSRSLFRLYDELKENDRFLEVHGLKQAATV